MEQINDLEGFVWELWSEQLSVGFRLTKLSSIYISSQLQYNDLSNLHLQCHKQQQQLSVSDMETHAGSFHASDNIDIPIQLDCCFPC